MTKSISFLSLVVLLTSVGFWSVGYCSGPVAEKPKMTKDIEIPERREFTTSQTVGACEDFFEYACRPVLNNFELPADRGSWTFAFDDSAERILRFKKQHLTKSVGKNLKNQRAQQYVNYYSSCMNVDDRKQHEQAAYDELVKELLALENAKEPKKALLEWLGKNISGTKPSLFGFFANNNQSDSNKVDFILGVDLRRLPANSYYENKQVLSDYTDVVEMLLQDQFGKAKERASAIVALEKDFAKNYPSRAAFRELWVKKSEGLSKAQFLEKYPNFYLSDLFKKFPDSTFLRHLYPEVYQYANELLEKASFAELRDYILAGYVRSHLEYLKPDVFEKYRAFRIKHLGAPPERPVLSERCTKATMGAFAPEMDSYLYERYFPSFPEQEFRDLAENVRKTMTAKLKANEWLSSSSKASALDKLASLGMQIVKPQKEKDWGFLPLRVYDQKNHVANLKILATAQIAQTLKELATDVDKDIWGLGPLTINAYYSPANSKFVMPAGILQYPFFDAQGSVYANLGAVGTVIGHEVGHAYDDQGSRYDKDGNLNPWMDEKDVKNFQDLSKKVDAQYLRACQKALANLDRLTVPDDSADPTEQELKEICLGKEGGKSFADLTRGESIGDIVGLRFSYETAFPKGKGSVEDKQKFFLQFGRVWCGVKRRGSYLANIKTAVHPSIPMRTNEPVRHLEGFYEAFNCKPEDPMYLPKDQRVNIW